MKQVCSRPRLILAGLSGGAGKTVTSLGVTRSLVRRGLKVKPYKKGPDYIDAMWLGLSAQATATNLDPFLMPEDTLKALFWHKLQDADIAIIEGNRGLFDGMDVEGSCSTAHLARLLETPVVLTMDCTKMTRTAAAVLQGVAGFEPGVTIAGVVLNRTAGPRHRSILRQSIEQYTDIPVLGALPKLSPNPIPERHMGLISNREYDKTEEILETIGDILEENVDMDRILAVAGQVPDPDLSSIEDLGELWPRVEEVLPAKPRIGYVRDAALWFYYEENLEALAQAGAELVELSLLQDTPWPELDGLYLGGGFPETLAEQIAANAPLREHVHHLAEQGMPIYAECGGFMFLCSELEYQGTTYPMSGILPVKTVLNPRPQGLGYVHGHLVSNTPFYTQGDPIFGHEFHYSHPEPLDGVSLDFAVELEKGTGMVRGKDGLSRFNAFASYTHIHALGVTSWAPNFVRAAAAFAASS